MSTTSLRATIPLSFDDAIARVIDELKAEGFGVLTRIDMRATMKAKLGKDFRRYEILGACNPPLAWRALSTDLDVGTMLPCNVVAYEADDGHTVIAAVDPARTLAAQTGGELAAVAGEVRAKLVRVVERVGQSSRDAG